MAAMAKLPPLSVKGLIRLEGQDPLAIVEFAGRSEIVKVGDGLRVRISNPPTSLVLHVQAIDRSGVQLLHRESGERIEAR